MLLCVFMVEGMTVVVNVILSLMRVMSQPGLVQPIGMHDGEVVYFGCFYFRVSHSHLEAMGELGFLNCDDMCMCVVNKQFIPKR